MSPQDPTDSKLPTAPSPPTATTTTLDADIGFSLVTGQLDQRQNALIPFNLIPPEILSHIFMLLVGEVTNHWGHSKNRFSWLNVTHVCRHWRGVALDSAPMWSDIRRFVHPQITKLMVDRSKNAPLTIDIFSLNKTHHNYERVLREALSQTHRLFSVSLGSLPEDSLDISTLLTSATGPAPILRSLRLYGDRGSPQPLPPNFLIDGAPALKALVLNSFDVSWNRIPLPTTLTKLHLRDAVTRPLPSEIFESLQNLHLVEDLRLNDYLPDGGFPSGLILPSLKTLETRDTWTRTSRFLGIIRVPNAKRIEVTIEDLVHQDSAIDSYIKVLKDTVQDILKSLPALSRFSMLNFDRDDAPTVDPPCFGMGWGQAPISAIECSNEDGLEVSLWLERIQTLSLPDALASINSHFNLNTVSALALDTSGQLGRDVFVDMLATLPNVQKLSLFLCRVSTILVKMQLDPALRHRAKQGDEAEIATPYFPALHTLVLDNIDFEEGEGVDELIYSLCAVIKKRPESNQVKTLDIRTCLNIGTDAFTKLQITLPNVDVQWDEVEDWSHHSTERGDSDDLDGSGEEVEPAPDSPEGSV